VKPRSHTGDAIEREKRRLSGRAYRPSAEARRIVRRMAAFGIAPASIASILNVARATLEHAFAAELAAGVDWLIDVVANALLTRARRGSVPAAIFLLKARAGWSERQVLVGAGGGPIEMTARITGPTVVWIDNGRGPPPPGAKELHAAPVQPRRPDRQAT
jgi:hypothetical protein